MIEKDNVEIRLEKMKNARWNKDAEKAASLFKRDTTAFDGIYEIKFNECVYFKSWEVER